MNQNIFNHLKVLEELVESGLNPLKTESPLTHAALDEVLSNVQAKQSPIKQSISKEVNLTSDIRLRKQIIQTFQVNLINILDCLTNLIETTIHLSHRNHLPHYKLLLGVQKAVYIVIENLLCYIGYRYYNYCNPDIRVSEKYKCLFVRELENKIREIECADLKLNHQLLEIAISRIKRRLSNTKMRLTYRLVLFYKELVRVTDDLKKIKNKEELDDELIRSLIFINFNSVFFVQYCVKRMKSGLENRYKTVDKIEFLALCLKRINQTPVRGGIALFKNYPSVKELLSQWVLDELGYWERKLQLYTPFSGDKNYMIETNIKIATSLSVPQLACFARLFVETGTITNKRKEDILEFFPEHYKTKKCESIEYGSFRTKYYAISESTKEHIRSLIITMLNELRNL